jgi:nucleotide-binding universal stress UspA family protein
MFNIILVPLDGTHFAEAALEPAISLARHYGSKIMLVRAGAEILFAHPPSGDSPTGMALQPYLRHIAGQIRAQGITTEIMETDEPASKAIVEIAAETGAELIVLATRQRSWIDRLIHPGIAGDLLRKVSVPLLLIRPDPVGSGQEITATAPFTESQAPILVPLDGSPLAEEVLPLAISLAQTYRKPLVLVRAVDVPYLNLYPEFSVAVAEPAEMQKARDYLEEQRRVLEAQGLAISTVVRRGLADSVIVQTAAERHADLIVMAAHVRTTLARFFLGSVTRGVLHLPGPAMLIQFGKPSPTTSALEGIRQAVR